MRGAGEEGKGEKEGVDRAMVGSAAQRLQKREKKEDKRRNTEGNMRGVRVDGQGRKGAKEGERERGECERESRENRGTRAVDKSGHTEEESKMEEDEGMKKMK